MLPAGAAGFRFSRAGIAKILMDMRSCRHAHRASAVLLCTSHVKQISFDRVSLGALWRRRSARQWRLHRQSRMQQSWQSFVPASSSRCCLPLLQVSALSDSAETSLHKLAGLSYH